MMNETQRLALRELARHDYWLSAKSLKHRSEHSAGRYLAGFSVGGLGRVLSQLTRGAGGYVVSRDYQGTTEYRITDAGRKALGEPVTSNSEQVDWAGRTFGQLSKDEQRRVTAQAGRQLEAELTASAGQIGAVLDAAEAEDAAARQREIESAYQHGGAAATADAQACKLASGSNLWRGRQHKLPTDRELRAAWMRGYGKVFAWWGGAGDDVQVTDS